MQYTKPNPVVAPLEELSLRSGAMAGAPASLSSYLGGEKEDKSAVETILGVDPSKLFEEEAGAPARARKSKSDKKDTAEIGDKIKKLGNKLSKEEIKKSQELIVTLSRYGASTRLGPYLSDQGFKLTATALKKLDVEELQETLERVKICVANKSETSIFSSGVLGAIQVVESISQRPGLKERVDLYGFNAYMQRSEQFMDALEEVRIETSIVTGLSSHTRLLLALGQGGVIVASSNAAARQSLAGVMPPVHAAPAAAPIGTADTKAEAKEREKDPDYVPEPGLGLGEGKAGAPARARGRKRKFDYSTVSVDFDKPQVAAEEEKK